MRKIVLALAVLASTALAAPALAAGSLDTTHPSSIETVAKADTADLVAPSTNISQTAATLNVEIAGNNIAASPDIYAFGRDNLTTFVPAVPMFDQPTLSLDLASIASPGPMMRYAVLMIMPTDYLGAMLDPAARARQIV
jgi:hypothetical protein